MTIQSMDVSEAREPSKNCCANSSNVKATLALCAVAIIGVSGIGAYLLMERGENVEKTPKPDPEMPLPPSPSKLHVFQNAAVCTDSPRCSQVGRDILDKGGNAIDAAAAAMFCNGLLNHQSMGLGGGFLMTVYIKSEKKPYSVIAREQAPGKATPDMFNGDAKRARKSPLAIAVPGEVKGLHLAHQKWGNLNWNSIVEPAVKICREGYTVSEVLHESLHNAPYIKNDKHLRATYFNEDEQQFHKINSIVKGSDALCKTLERIAEKGGDEMYRGQLAKDLAKDLNEARSIITEEDLANYEAKITEPLIFKIDEDNTIFTPPPPGSGAILIEILNILKEYHMNASSIGTKEAEILTYHRMLETFKFAYATRTKLGDVDFVQKVKEIINEVINPTYGKKIMAKINDNKTSNETFYYNATKANPPDAGTAHLSVIDKEGNAVSVTSSINYYFGAGLSMNRTGIVMNNVMDDFSYPGIVNFFGVEPSPENFVAPRKRPLSSMSPAVVVNKDGDVKLVIGASGGTKITTAVALVIMRHMWLGQSIKQAVDEPRIHHQIYPMDAFYEYGVTKDIVEGLRAKGHGMQRYEGRGSIVCALFRNTTGIYANADYRKGGDVSGM